MWAEANDRRLFVPVVLAIVLAAWLLLALWGASPAGYLLDHRSLGDSTLRLNESYLLMLLAFVFGWTLMTVAMMLPSVLPLLGVLRRAAGAGKNVASSGAIAGYIAVWSVFGAAVHVMELAVHRGVASHAWLDAHVWVLGAIPLLTAGLYQFTRLKRHCLAACRSPFSFVVRRWHGEGHFRQGLRIGVDHGIFCVGCCWALMLLMFAVSVGNFAWMLALAAAMGTEKNAAWGYRLTAPIGVVSLTAGLTIVGLNL
jgi:predicted metal-binding membrane protein